jgi:phage baseplate assembly protein W
MDRETGRYLDGETHLKQSIRDILMTAVGERLIVRHYGSSLFQYIDRPLSDKIKIEVIATIASAIHDFEPRIKLAKVSFERVQDATAQEGAHLALRLDGIFENRQFVEYIPI